MSREMFGILARNMTFRDEGDRQVFAEALGVDANDPNCFSRENIEKDDNRENDADNTNDDNRENDADNTNDEKNDNDGNDQKDTKPATPAKIVQAKQTQRP